MLKAVIADDSALVRERLAELIAELEAVELIGQAGDAQEAVELIQRLKPDVAVLDIRLTEGTGLQVLESIKANSDAPVVIMLTAFPYPQYRKKCLAAGAEYFFDKATDFEHVADVLRMLGDRPVNRPVAGPGRRPSVSFNGD